MSDLIPTFLLDTEVQLTTDPVGDPVHEANMKIDPDHVFRHAAEVEKDTHGGYLEGFIELPTTTNLQVELSFVPSSESSQLLHPALLHNTVKDGRGKRINKNPLTAGDWRVIFTIVNDKVYYGRHELRNCLQGNILTLGPGAIMITVITPLQTNKEKGVKIVDVLRKRMAEEGVVIQKTPEEIALSYTNKRLNTTAKLDLNRGRLRARFSSNSNAFTIFSDDICNSRHKDVGALDCFDVSINRACNGGGSKIILLSEFKMMAGNQKGTKPPPVYPRFILRGDRIGGDQAILPESIYPDFRQFSLETNDLQVHNGTAIIARVPSQRPEVVRAIRAKMQYLEIVLHRKWDDMYSKTKHRFTYELHDVDDCPFCLVLGGDTQFREKVRAARGKPKRRRPTNPSGESAYESSNTLSPWSLTSPSHVAGSPNNVTGSPGSVTGSPNNETIMSINSPQTTFNEWNHTTTSNVSLRGWNGSTTSSVSPASSVVMEEVRQDPLERIITELLNMPNEELASAFQEQNPEPILDPCQFSLDVGMYDADGKRPSGADGRGFMTLLIPGEGKESGEVTKDSGKIGEDSGDDSGEVGEDSGEVGEDSGEVGDSGECRGDSKGRNGSKEIRKDSSEEEDDSGEDSKEVVEEDRINSGEDRNVSNDVAKASREDSFVESVHEKADANERSTISGSKEKNRRVCHHGSGSPNNVTGSPRSVTGSPNMERSKKRIVWNSIRFVLIAAWIVGILGVGIHFLVDQ